MRLPIVFFILYLQLYNVDILFKTTLIQLVIIYKRALTFFSNNFLIPPPPPVPLK